MTTRVTLEQATDAVQQLIASLGEPNDRIIVSIAPYDEGWLFGWQRAAFILGDVTAASLQYWPLFVDKRFGQIHEITFFKGIAGAYEAALEELRQRLAEDAGGA